MRAKKSLNIEVGLRIRNVRDDLNLTREQLAEACEMTPRFLACVENGQSGVSLESLKKLSAGLRVSTDYLLFGRKCGKMPQDIIDAVADVPEDCYDQLVELIRLVGEIAKK